MSALSGMARHSGTLEEHYKLCTINWRAVRFINLQETEARALAARKRQALPKLRHLAVGLTVAILLANLHFDYPWLVNDLNDGVPNR